MKSHRHFRFLFPIMTILFMIGSLQYSCSNKKERLNRTTNKIGQNKRSNAVYKAPIDVNIPKQKDRKIGKAIFYIENSASMFGYINDFTEYVDVVSELAEKPRFVEEGTNREFYFVNGGENISITKIGVNPAVLKDKLTLKGFDHGDVSKSNLNSMFQLALSKAKNDTISILISDAIYDIGKKQAPMNALSTEGRETRSRFIERLNEGDLQTIIIKLSSYFSGNYFPVTGGRVKLSQKRPFYVCIFGETELLNKYFHKDYIESLEGYSDVARFLKLNGLIVPYQVTVHEKGGNFNFDRKNKNKLVNVKTGRKGKGFQFVIAVDFSALPFSNSYLASISNYFCSNPNYSVKKVRSIGDVKLYGLKFSPTHLVTVYADKNPLGRLNISLVNTVPNWIVDTNIDNDANIIGDTYHTFGFKFLTDAINEAYQYKNQGSDVATFKFELIK